MWQSSLGSGQVHEKHYTLLGKDNIWFNFTLNLHSSKTPPNLPLLVWVSTVIRWLSCVVCVCICCGGGGGVSSNQRRHSRHVMSEVPFCDVKSGSNRSCVYSMFSLSASLLESRVCMQLSPAPWQECWPCSSDLLCWCDFLWVPCVMKAGRQSSFVLSDVWTGFWLMLDFYSNSQTFRLLELMCWLKSNL